MLEQFECQSRDFPTKLCCNTIIHLLFHYCLLLGSLLINLLVHSSTIPSYIMSTLSRPGLVLVSTDSVVLLELSVSIQLYMCDW